MNTWFARVFTTTSIAAAALFLMSSCGPSPPANTTTDQASGDSIRFVNITAEAGLGDFSHETGAFGKKWFPETVGGGGGFIDYNGDGWLDILLVGGGVWQKSEHDPDSVRALRMYRNNGDGSFSEVTGAVGLGDISAYGFGITVADYDNDGDSDFFFTTLHENMLFRNEGSSFTEVGRRAGLTEQSNWSTSAIFFDADNDGHLDLYVGNYVHWSPENDKWCTLDGETKEYCTPDVYEGIPGRFYHNDGDGTFTDRTAEAGFLSSPGNSFGIAALDYNRDGRTDLAVANDMQRNLLYENEGDGTFDERGSISGVAYGRGGAVRAGMGIDAGYVSGADQPSIVVGNFTGEMIGVFRHTGEGLFTDRAAISNVGNASLRFLTFGLFLFDAEMDGDLDLFAANGHIKPGLEHIQNGISYRQQAQLYVNYGHGSFTRYQPDAGVFTDSLVGRGAAYGDVDRDGDLDILITENGGAAHLWRNESARGNVLRISLQGTSSNRDGLGSRIHAVAGNQRLTRFVRTGSSYLSHSASSPTLGLGDAETVDSLTVRWPSGRVDRFTDIPANRHIQIHEGSSSIESAAALETTNK